MKLSQVLSHTNQFERSKFINCIDKLCQDNKDDTELVKQLYKIDGQLKAASGNEIKELFNLVRKHLKTRSRTSSDGGPTGITTDKYLS
ncbi:hypothetical protein AB6C94_18835 [Vibrio splendidus]|uniref:hypothetical protein n=1 Tax=Vibrio splendidus TaxID=29497 RepID=UPI000CB2513E|nr:hypothetical protein [Vibrio splendidus]PMJ61652.1 hypothetical protein BCU23_02835 [Vibrio splendidus]